MQQNVKFHLKVALHSLQQTFLCKLDANNKMELEEYLFPVSCVTSQTSQALGVFSENDRKRVITWTLNVNISESEAIFPMEFRRCFASVAHYNMT